jgi:O-antigen/teichoic acid export membrane protein
MITMSATTIISYYYTAEELGYYSFANTISINVVLIIQSFMFILYPKILNRLSTASNEDSISLLKQIRDTYILGADFLSVLSLFVIPVIFIFFPQYLGILNSFKILTIAQIILNITNGYSQYLISQKKESIMTKIGVLSIISVIGLCLIFRYFGLPFYYIPFSVCVGTIIYSVLIVTKAYNLLGLKFTNIFVDFFSIHKILVICIILFSFFANENIITPLLACVYYFIVNRKKIKSTIIISFKTLTNKGILSI